MNSRYLCAALAGAATLAAGTALAHHSFSQEFDPTRPMTLSGKVVKFEWVNPHSWIHIDVINKRTGTHQTWRVEGGAPSALLRRGWNRNSLPAGTSIVVNGYASPDNDTRASAAEITFPDGRQLSLGNPATEAVQAAARRANSR